MYRKLMFLISFVALLVLSNVTFAADIWWDGGGTGDSWCTPENWDGDVVPGLDDNPMCVYRPDGENRILIDCNTPMVDQVRLPYGGPAVDPCLTVVDIVSDGILNCDGIRVRGWDSKNCTTIWNLSGTGTVLCAGGMIFSEKAYGGKITTATINLSDDARFIAGGRLKMGSNSGTVLNIKINDDSIFSIGKRGEFEDDGSARIVLNSGTLYCGSEWYVKGRSGNSEFIVNGGEWYIGGPFNLGYKTGGNDPNLFTLLDISGGTCNFGAMRLSGSGAKGDCTINVSNGLMVCRGLFKIQNGNDDAINSVNLSGTGVIKIQGDLEIADGNNGFDITDLGTLIFDGDKLPEVMALVREGKLTGCGGDPRAIEADFNVTNPGRTTVTADCSYNNCMAWGPWPADTETEIHSSTTDVILAWIEGDCVGMQGYSFIYFGTSEAAVAAATQIDPELQDYIQFRGGPATYNINTLLPPLPLWETYYWKIDEFNTSPTGQTPGEVWSFTTGCAAIVGDVNMDCIVNFLDFAELANTFGEEELWPE